MPPGNARLRLLLPVAASLALHACLLALLATVTWTIAHAPQRDAEPVELLLSSPPPSHAEAPQQVAPPARTPRNPTRPAPHPPPQVARAQASPPAPPEAGAALESLARATPARADPGDAWRALAGANQPQVAFSGLRARRASRVVFVIDAAGSMTASFPFLIQELERSLGRLRPDQRFAVLVARDRSHNDPGSPAVQAPPGAGAALVGASPEAIAHTLAWLREHVQPQGRSDPLPGLERALMLQPRPEAIFLLTRSIPRTLPRELSPPGQALPAPEDEDDQPWGESWRRRLLATLHRLNPPGPSGHPPTQVKVIQLLEEDPTGILKDIGERFGGPGGGYAVRRLEELSAPRLGPDPMLELDRRLDDAAAALAQLSRERLDLLALFGPPLDDRRRQQVRRGAGAALAALSGEQVDDPAQRLLSARAWVLLAAMEHGDQRRASLERAGAILAGLQNAADLSDPSAQLESVIRSELALLDGDPQSAREHLDAATASPAAATLSAELDLLAIATSADVGVAAARSRDVQEAALAAGDPLLAVLAADACALRLAREGTLDAVLSLYLGLPGHPALEPARREAVAALVDERLELATREIDDHSLAGLDPRVALARSRRLIAAEPASERAEAILRTLVARDDAATSAPGAMRLLAGVLGERENIFQRMQSADLLLALARQWPQSAEARGAAQAALQRSRHIAETSDRRGPALTGYRQVLRDALAIEPLEHRDFWAAEQDRILLELALVHNSTFSLHLLEEIRPDAPGAAEAVRLYGPHSQRAVVDALEAYESFRDAPGERAADEARVRLETAERLLRNAIAFYARHGIDENPLEHAMLADVLSLMERPAEAAALYEQLMASPHASSIPGGRDELQLRLGRALRRAGEAERAFVELRELAERLEAGGQRGERYWRAWTNVLEILAAQEPSAQRTAALRSHLARLRTVDGELGGQPWKSRLEGLAASGPSGE